MLLLECELVGRGRLLDGPLRVPREPRSLRASGVDVAEPLEVTSRPGNRERLVERVERARVAAPCPQAPERDQALSRG